MKKVLIVIFALVLIVLIGAAVFVYTFDANKYKNEVAEVAASLIGRPVNIRGDVEISVYPWIGIKLNDMSIKNLPGFSAKNFATVGQFDISIKISPLFENRLDIDKLVMHKLSVDFEKNKNGESNWQGISSASDNKIPGEEIGITGFVIGGIELVDAHFNWLDARTGKKFKISKMSMVTEAVVKGQPLPITLKAYIQSNQPEWQASISSKSNLVFNEDAPTFNANNLKLSVKALLPGDNNNVVSFAMLTDSVVNFNENTAKLTKTKFSIYGLIISGVFDVSDIFSIPAIQGPIKVKRFEASKLAKRLKVDMPEMVDPESLSNIALSAKLKTNFNDIYLDDISANVDESKINGFIHISDISQPLVRYDLDVDKIDFNKYATVTNKNGNGEIMLPLDLIRAVNLEGSFDVDDIIADDVEMKSFHVTSTIKDDVVKANPLTMLVGDSKVKAAMILDTRSIPLGKFTIEAKNIDARASINPLLKTIMGKNAIKLDGIVTARANINTKGSSVARQKKSAKGTVAVDMGDVVIQGIDLNHAARSVVATYANKNNFRTRKSYVPEYEPDRNTEFSKLHATFQVAHGKFNNRDLLLVSKDANIRGSGSIDFINEKLDFRPVIDTHVKSRIDIRDKLRDHPMEYHVNGDFENLSTRFEMGKYELLVGRVLVQESKARRNKELNATKKRLY